jgi:hypothetical protein
MNDLLHPALKKSRRVELCTRRGRETEQSLQKSNLFTPRSLEHTGRLHANPGQSFEFGMSATFSGEILPQRFKQVIHDRKAATQVLTAKYVRDFPEARWLCVRVAARQPV